MNDRDDDCGESVPLERYDFIGAFLNRTAQEDRHRIYLRLSATPTAPPEPGEQPASAPRPLPHVRVQYFPAVRTYTEQELERIIKPPFTARVHVDKMYHSARPVLERYRTSADAGVKLGHLDQALDTLHAERHVLRELTHFARYARLVYGHHVPLIETELKTRIDPDITRYLESRKTLVNRILAQR